jgi:hypothetical protein
VLQSAFSQLLTQIGLAAKGKLFAAAQSIARARVETLTDLAPRRPELNQGREQERFAGHLPPAAPFSFQVCPKRHSFLGKRTAIIVLWKSAHETGGLPCVSL